MDALTQIVRDVAAKEVRPLFRNLDKSDIDIKSAPDDLVTVADRAAELATAAAVAKLLPDAAIVGEEAVSADAAILDRVGQGRPIVSGLLAFRCLLKRNKRRSRQSYQHFGERCRCAVLAMSTARWLRAGRSFA